MIITKSKSDRTPRPVSLRPLAALPAFLVVVVRRERVEPLGYDVELRDKRVERGIGLSSST